MDPSAKQIGRRTKALRDEQGLTLEQLSERSNIAPASLSRIERGRTMPSLRTLTRLARGLGVKPVDLLGEEDLSSVSAEGISPEVRGVAMLLSGASPATLSKARRILQVLVEAE